MLATTYLHNRYRIPSIIKRLLISPIVIKLINRKQKKGKKVIYTLKEVRK